MVITIAILGILAGIAYFSLGGSLAASQQTMARARVEMLNSALKKWAMVNPEMYYPASESATTDELFVLRSLQYRNPDEDKAAPGSPFVPAEYNPQDSTSEQDYRLRWNGRIFELLEPGQPGTGLRMAFDASDMTEPVTFDENYKPGSF